MPTICRCRSAPCTPMSSARRMRTPSIVAIDGAPRWRTTASAAVITGEEVRKLSEPFRRGETPVQQWALAVERVRYVGEPVALVVAEAAISPRRCQLVNIEYAPLEAIIDPCAACEDRRRSSIRRPRPMNLWCEVCLRRRGCLRARRSPHRHDDGISRCVPRRSNVTSWLPSTIQPRAATMCWRTSRAVQHASGDGAGAARDRTECACASRRRFSAAVWHKLSVFPYVVLISLAAKSPADRWNRVEDRIEHLVAASSGRTASPKSKPRLPRTAASRAETRSASKTATFLRARCRGRSTACTAR